MRCSAGAVSNYLSSDPSSSDVLADPGKVNRGVANVSSYDVHDPKFDRGVIVSMNGDYRPHGTGNAKTG